MQVPPEKLFQIIGEQAVEIKIAREVIRDQSEQIARESAERERLSQQVAEMGKTIQQDYGEPT